MGHKCLIKKNDREKSREARGSFWGEGELVLYPESTCDIRMMYALL
jgi:hypothetical protein